MSTNPVESMIEIVRDHARNVKHWQPGDMRLRWAAAGMLETAKQFRRIKGYTQLPQLASATRKQSRRPRIVPFLSHRPRSISSGGRHHVPRPAGVRTGTERGDAR